MRCACPEPDTFHDFFEASDCHTVPMPPVPHTVRIVDVSRHHWDVVGFESAFRLANALRRGYPDRWIDIKVDGHLVALLEPQALAEDTDQLELGATP